MKGETEVEVCMSEATAPPGQPPASGIVAPLTPHTLTGEHGAAGEDLAGPGEATHGAGQAEAVPELPAEAALPGRRGAPLPVWTEGRPGRTPGTRSWRGPHRKGLGWTS